jgi:predicted RNA-binding Zn-ribbon protein involved in translation (DUF1610 family)
MKNIKKNTPRINFSAACQVNLEKVFASLNTTCPKCGKVISPSEIRRVSFDEMICPECGE